jgi:hypothetical protein
LRDLPEALQLTNSQLTAYIAEKKQQPLKLPINEEGKTKDVHLYKLRSTYESIPLRKAYHLHPEAIHSVFDSETNQSIEATVLCPECYGWYKNHSSNKSNSDTTKNAFPRNSIASGLDFGDIRRLGLEEPTLAEKTILARHRHFHCILKVNNNHRRGGRSDRTACQVRGSSIIFKHDAPVVANVALMSTKLKDGKAAAAVDSFKKSITVQLVGSEGSEIDNIYRMLQFQTHLKARPHIIYQRLLLYQHCHKEYMNDAPLVSGNDKNFTDIVDQFERGIGNFNNTITSRENIIETTDEIARNTDKVGGDDTAQI